MLKIGQAKNGAVEVTELFSIESDEFEKKVTTITKRELDRYGLRGEEIDEVRLTFLNAKDSRESAKETKKTIKKTAIGTLTTAILYVLYQGIKFYAGASE